MILDYILNRCDMFLEHESDNKAVKVSIDDKAEFIVAHDEIQIINDSGKSIEELIQQAKYITYRVGEYTIY